MELVTKNLDELKYMPGNTRLHSERQIKEYMRSIKMFGQLRPMIIDENNIVLAGNGLLTALKQLGQKQGACYVVQGLSDKAKKKLMLADNRIAALGEEDEFAFEETLYSLEGDFDIPGYGAELLRNITSDLKSIDAIGEAKVQRAGDNQKDNKKTVAEIICPQCGCIIRKDQKKCREKQSDRVDIEAVRI